MTIFLLILWLFAFIISTIYIIYDVATDAGVINSKGALIIFILSAIMLGPNLILSFIALHELATYKLPWITDWLSSPVRRKK